MEGIVDSRKLITISFTFSSHCKHKADIMIRQQMKRETYIYDYSKLNIKYLRILDFRQLWTPRRGKFFRTIFSERKFSVNSSFLSQSSHTVLLLLLLLLFGIAELTRLQLPKCNNHLVSFINVDGLSVSYIVHIFDTIKSRTMVYRSMDCRHF